MGWMFKTSQGGFKQLVEERTKGWETETSTVKCIAKQFKGNVRFKGNLWTVWEHTDKQTGHAKRFIVLFLMECRGGCWGYKDVDECMGPCEVNCPLAYLDLVKDHPPGNEYAQAWREKVRQYHAEQVKPAKGKWFQLRKNSWGLEKCLVTSVRPLTGQTPGGASFKLKRSLLLREIEAK